MRSVLVTITGSSLSAAGLEVKGRVCGRAYSCLIPSSALADMTQLDVRNTAAERLAAAWLDDTQWSVEGEVVVTL